jgi:hypothetical protein
MILGVEMIEMIIEGALETMPSTLLSPNVGSLPLNWGILD